MRGTKKTKKTHTPLPLPKKNRRWKKMLIIHDDYELKIRFQSTWDRERKGRGGGTERGGEEQRKWRGRWGRKEEDKRKGNGRVKVNVKRKWEEGERDWVGWSWVHKGKRKGVWRKRETDKEGVGMLTGKRKEEKKGGKREGKMTRKKE